MRTSRASYSGLGASGPATTRPHIFRSGTATICTVAMVMALTVHAQAQGWLTNGLLAYYPLNGNANDASGNGHNGVVYGATSTMDRFGNANGACYFAGGPDYIWIGTNVRPARITACAWFNTTGDGGVNRGSGFPAQAILRDRVGSWSLTVAAEGWGQPVGALGATLYRSDPGSPVHL